ncbi:DUF4349 domain-containing protein [Dethiothermospora halolimnae]|uniref:DUF4349 domain-containing protein n=1 Tax=Dethiothermospora halolimnae TaxID=3114390 RepID=UPI003CCC1655
MRCNEFNNKISFYIDGELTNIEKKEFEIHLMECDRCRKEYQNMIKIIKLTQDDVIELPNNYHEKLKGQLRQVSGPKGKRKNLLKAVSSLAAVLILVVGLYSFMKTDFNSNDTAIDHRNEIKITNQAITAKDKGFKEAKKLGNENNKKNEVLNDKKSTKSSIARENNIGTSTKPNDKITIKDGNKTLAFRGMSSRKITKKYFITANINDFDKDYKDILNYISENGGLIKKFGINENLMASEVDSYKSGYINFLMPDAEYKKTVDFITQIGDIKNQRIEQEDVTEEYNNILETIKKYKESKDRYIKMKKEMDKNNSKLEFEEKIARLEGEIDANVKIKQKLEQSVEYIIINLNLNKNNQ